MDRQQDIELLAASALFAGAEQDVLRRALDTVHIRNLPRDALLFEQEALPTHLFILRSGRIKVARTTDEGSVMTIRFMTAGDLLGCLAVFRNVPFPATAQAMIDSTVFSWPLSYQTELIAQPRLAQNIIKLLGARTEEMVMRLQDVSSEPVERRVARGILRLITDKGFAIDGTITLGFPVTRQDIAELTGTTLYTVSRILSRWDKEGLVKSVRQRLVILDPQGIAQIAQSPAPHAQSHAATRF